VTTAIDQMKFEDLEREMLNPLRGLPLTKDELFVATMLLEATAARPIGIKRLRRALHDAERPITERDVKDIIRSLRKKHELPIISRRANGSGFWWCENEAQMKEYATRARKQPMDELHTLSRIVKANYPRLAGQLSLEEIDGTSK
jgi:hypothetical protein